MAESQDKPETEMDEETKDRRRNAEGDKRLFARDDELSEETEFEERLDKVFNMVTEAYKNQYQRVDDQKDYWDIYECELNENQIYNGNSEAYIPLVRDAINARKTRFSNQLFPLNGRSVRVITEDGTMPYAEMAIAEHYIRKAKLRTDVVPALCKNGDIEGQYNIYVDWFSTTRHVTSIQTITDESGTHQDVVEEEVEDAYPDVEVLPDADVVIFPATADNIDKALAAGGGVAIARRWTKEKINQLVDDGELVEEVADKIIGEMDAVANGDVDMKKEHVSASGIKGRGKHYLARETWHTMEVNGTQRLVRSYFGCDQFQKLGTKLNPFWCDLVPVISCAVEKESGAAKGSSLLKSIDKLQYAANDFLNEACDSATYSMMPIVMTDPSKNPRTASMILDLAAVWETNPNDTKFAEFPKLWQQGFELISALKNQIHQSLGVNPSMIPATSGKKRSQADIANEQAVDILTTADAVTILEEGILTPMLVRFVAYDMQFRNDDILVPMYGMLGKRAKMQRIPPLQFENRYQFQWSGVQSARNALQVQQKVSFINVLAKVPPQMYRDHRIDATAILEEAAESMFGPEIAPLTFVSVKDELSIPQEEENEFLIQGFPVPVSPMDDDQEHLKKLQPILESDTTGVARQHAMAHQRQIQMKAQQAQMQQLQHMGMLQGQQQGGGPRPGAQVSQGRPAQQPAGAIAHDSMPRAGVVPMPRRA